MDPNSVNSLISAYPWNLVVAFVPLAAGLIGACLGGWMVKRAALKGVSVMYEMDVRKQQAQQKSALQNYYKSLLVEVETLWHTYQEAIGLKLESLKQRDPINLYCPITPQHFLVYRKNSTLIGCIADDTLRSLLVKTYAEIQGLIETYRINNRLLAQWEHWDQTEKGTHDALSAARAQGAYAVLVEYANVLRKAHYTARADVLRLIGLLQHNIEAAP